jgi:hypothetical protein
LIGVAVGIGVETCSESMETGFRSALYMPSSLLSESSVYGIT